jgi:hypothetical protein
MDSQTLSNWRKIKETMEAAGKTDNQYYKRACSILAGRPDPMDVFNQPLRSPRPESSESP